MLLDGSNRRIELSRQIGNKGGEGTVYEIVGNSQSVAKIFHHPPKQAQIDKIEACGAIRDPVLRKIAALPSTLLRKNGVPVGLIMPKVSGTPIHLLYRPVDRREHFPKAGWQHLVVISRNCAAAFHSLHSNSVVMGDVNETNLMVTPEGEIRLIDCDSYQWKVGGRVIPCEVGVGMWTPPELQGAPFNSTLRAEQHDAFGLAVLIFHMLFMGMHPFAGVPKNRQQYDNPPTLEERIKRHQFAHTLRGKVEVLPPPFSISLKCLPDFVADLFEQAFLWCVETFLGF